MASPVVENTSHYRARWHAHARWYLLAGLALANVALWQTLGWAEAHRGRAFVYVLDVGQGDAIFLEAPGGNQVLVDGGPDRTVLARLGEILPFWDRSLDLVILTHPHADHLSGLLEVLRRYRVGMVLESGLAHTIAEYAEWESELSRRRIPRAVARRGQAVELGGGAELTVLAPARSWAGVPPPRNIHTASVVASFRFASSTALLTADAESPLERELIASGVPLQAELLKVGHHGSKTSSSGPFLAAVRPRLAAVSAGRRNRYGHPHPEVLDRLAAAGVRVFRTDQAGTITFASDGRQFTVSER